MIYILVLIFLLFCIYRYDIKERKLYYHFFWITSLIVFILISGLRYKIGSDTIIYQDEYQSLPTFVELFSFDFSSTRYNFFWILFCAICKLISPSYFFMQFIQATIINCIYFYFIYKNTQHRYIALFLYFILGFLYFNTEIMRESIAVGFFLLSINSYYKRNWFIYYLIVFIAFLFHPSALFTFVLPFFSRIKINNKFIYSIIIVILSISLLWNLFYKSINYFSIFSGLRESIRPYLTNAMFVSNTRGIIFALFAYVLLPFISVLMAKRYFKESPKEAPFLWMYITLGLFVIFNNTISTRFQNYLFFPFIVFLSNLFYELYTSNKCIHLRSVKIWVLFIGLLIGRYYNYFKTDVTSKTFIYQRYFPYSSVITKKETEERKALEDYRLKNK